MTSPADWLTKAGVGDVSRETLERLTEFVGLLDRWRGITDLISDESFQDVWRRHVADSAQLISLARGAHTWVDMGTGAGFPGMVIALLLKAEPDCLVHLIESNQRKAAFLREAARTLAAPVIVYATRIERAGADIKTPVDVVTARALSSLPHTLALARPWLENGAVGLFPRGRSVRTQLNALANDGALVLDERLSRIDPAAVILRVCSKNSATRLSAMSEIADGG
jgi:16S rRNA (guanine527-N7)-methyltransferase